MKKTIKKSMRKKDEKKGSTGMPRLRAEPWLWSPGTHTNQQDILRIGTILGKKTKLQLN